MLKAKITCALFFITVLSYAQDLTYLGELGADALPSYMVNFSRIRTHILKKIDSTLSENVENSYDSLVTSYTFLNTLEFYRYVVPCKYVNDSIKLSGLLIVPKKSIRYKTIIYFHGTNPPLKSLAVPSDFNLRDKPRKMFFELKYLMILADLGYSVLVPDYIGYGESSIVEHPYTVIKPNVEATYTSYSSLQKKYPTKLNSSQGVISLGISEGGAYALGMHKLLEQANKALSVQSYPCEGPYNYNLTLKWLFNGSPKTKLGILFYVWSAYSQLKYFYPYSSLGKNLFKIKRISQRRIFKFNRFLGNNDTPYRYLNSVAISPILKGNNLEINTISSDHLIYNDWTPKGAITFFHSGRDQVVPEINTKETVQELSGRTNNISFQYFPQKGHISLWKTYFGYLIKNLK